jgi:hypothetical protein
VQIALIDYDLMAARPRVTATLPQDVYEFLAEWAEREQRPLSNLVSYVLTTATRKIRDEQQQKNGSASPQTQSVSPLPETKPSSRMPDTKPSFLDKPDTKPPSDNPQQTKSPSPSKSKGDK